MKTIFKNFFRHKTKYVLLFFCFAILAAPLLTSAQSPTLPANQQSPLLTNTQTATQPAPGVLDYLNTAARLNPLAVVTNYAAGKVAGGVSYILGVVIGWVAYVITYIIASIFGVAVGILAWFISIVLQLNTNIVQSNIVTSGFRVTLALANLGFVMAIIVIAIMTILRYETYALKKTLWKLVAAAILVNFSLVIGAAILNFADTLTLYFLNAFNPGGSISAFDSFSTSLAGAFAPQRVFLNLNAQGQSFTDTNFDKFAGAGTNFAATLVALMNIFFSVIFLTISVIALFGLFIMLLIRYVYLGILLILMPMAWLLWIFPATSGQWQKWWSNFIKWTIFAPVVMFFLYLALMTLGGANANQVNDPNSFFNGLGITNNANSPIVGFVSTSLGGSTPTFGSTFLGSLLQMAMMVAMLFAGLYMAQAMGIMFADVTLKGATAVTKGFGKWTGRKGVQAGGWAMRKTGIPKLAEKMQRGVGAKPAGLFKKAYKYTGAEFAVQKLGQGVEALHTTTREGLVKDAQKRMSNYTDDQLIHGSPVFTSPEKIFAMNELGKRDLVDKERMSDTHRAETKNLAAEYGYAKDYNKNVEKKSGVNSEMYELSKKIDKAIERNAPQNEIDDLQDELYKESVKFASTFSRAEAGDMQSADLHGLKEGTFGLNDVTITRLASASAFGFATAAPQFASAIYSRLKGKSLDNFEREYKNGIDHAERTGTIDGPGAQKRRDDFDTIIARNATWFGATGGGGTTQGAGGGGGGANP